MVGQVHLHDSQFGHRVVLIVCIVSQVVTRGDVDLELWCQEISCYSGMSLVATVVTVLLVGLVNGYLLQE